MHELSIAASIVEVACRHASGRRVQRVVVKAGHLRQIVPSALTFSFDLVAQGTAAEGALLVVESVPAIGLCRDCGLRTQLEMFPLQCGACGAFNPDVVEGEELIFETLDLEEAECGMA